MSADVIIKPVMSNEERERTDSLAATMASVQQEEVAQGLRLENARLRQVISCAVCAVCGDEIADQTWTVNDSERLVHKVCENGT